MMGMSSNRENVYSAINNERSYQEKKWGATHDSEHTVGEWLLIMESELSEAKEAWVKNGGDRNALLEILQVISVGVACLEVHGVVERERCGVAHPQPVATLCEAAEALMLFVDQHCNYHDLDPLLADCRHALTAERKRQAELDPLLRHVVLWYKRKVNQETGADEILIHNIANYLRHTDALDAHDKGVRNG